MTALAEPTVSREKPPAPLADRIRRAEAPTAMAIPVDKIDVATNVRGEDLGNLDELAASIREHGILEPITVTAAGDRFLVKTGHRRLAAAKLAGVEVLPALVDHRASVGAAGAPRSIEQLIENLQREDLNALAQAKALREVLAADKSLTQAALAQQLGKSAPWVANSLAILKVDPSVQAFVESGELSAAHVRAITGLPAAEQRRAAAEAVKNGSSAHDLERNAQWYRERQGDLAKREKETASAGKRAVEALTKAGVSTDIKVYLQTPWNVDREAIDKAVQAAGWQVTAEGWATPPGAHCTCTTMQLHLKDGDGSTVDRVCVSESHRQAVREEADRVRNEKAAAARVEQTQLESAVRARLELMDPTAARLLLRQIHNYNGKPWSEYEAMPIVDVAAELARYIGATNGAKPIPHAAVLEALGYVPEAPAPAAKSKGPRPRPQTSIDEAVTAVEPISPEQSAANGVKVAAFAQSMSDAFGRTESALDDSPEAVAMAMRAAKS